MSKYYGYARVSTTNQKTDRQLDALDNYAKENDIMYDCIFTDRMSGHTFDRPQYKLLKDNAKKGDTIIIKELDRLGRNYNEMTQELAYFKSNNIDIVIIDTPLPEFEDESMTELVQGILINFLSYVAEKERERTSKRIREGLKTAKDNGVNLGRPETTLPKVFFKYYPKWKDGDITGTAFADIMGVSRQTMYRWVKLHEKEEKKAS